MSDPHLVLPTRLASSQPASSAPEQGNQPLTDHLFLLVRWCCSQHGHGQGFLSGDAHSRLLDLHMVPGTHPLTTRTGNALKHLTLSGGHRPPGRLWKRGAGGKAWTPGWDRVPNKGTVGWLTKLHSEVDVFHGARNLQMPPVHVAKRSHTLLIPLCRTKHF